MTKKTDNTQPETSFEEALESLESIIEKIESGEIGLEESIAQYEHGVALINRCRGILNRAEQRVEELTDRMKTDGQDQAGGASA